MTTQDLFDLFPIGTIFPFAGLLADVPHGWSVCDGNNNTADLNGRVPVGIGPGAALDQIAKRVGQQNHFHGFAPGTTVARTNWGAAAARDGSPGNLDASPNGHDHGLDNVTTTSVDNLPLATQLYFIQKVQ